MRVGDFGVEVVAVRDGDVRELPSGHVLARGGAVYALRLRNYGPLRAVSEVRIDGTTVTAGGLVLDPYSAVVLERPIDAREAGRFTVIAEGDERVFGPDGGRDNPSLGLIEVRCRRELPTAARPSVRRVADDPRPIPTISVPPLERPRIAPAPDRPMSPPEWTPPGFNASADRPIIGAFRDFVSESAPPYSELIEGAAGTGLTGHSSQTFAITTIGPLESEATVISLRLVIGSEDALAAARPLPDAAAESAPARPAARP